MLNKSRKRRLENKITNQIEQSAEPADNLTNDEPNSDTDGEFEYRLRNFKYRSRFVLSVCIAVCLVILEIFLCWKSMCLMDDFKFVLEVYQSSNNVGVLVLYGVMSFSLILGIVSVAIGMLNVYSTRKSKKANTADLIKAIRAIKWQK